eukprot:gene35077-45406_t
MSSLTSVRLFRNSLQGSIPSSLCAISTANASIPRISTYSNPQLTCYASCLSTKIAMNLGLTTVCVVLDPTTRPTTYPSMPSRFPTSIPTSSPGRGGDLKPKSRQLLPEAGKLPNVPDKKIKPPNTKLKAKKSSVTEIQSLQQ